MAKTAKARAAEARVNDTITRYNRLLVGDPPEGVPVATLDPPVRSWREWYERTYGEQNRAWRRHYAARVKQFGGKAETT